MGVATLNLALPASSGLDAWKTCLPLETSDILVAQEIKSEIQDSLNSGKVTCLYEKTYVPLYNHANKDALSEANIVKLQCSELSNCSGKTCMLSVYGRLMGVFPVRPQPVRPYTTQSWSILIFFYWSLFYWSFRLLSSCQFVLFHFGLVLLCPRPIWSSSI